LGRTSRWVVCQAIGSLSRITIFTVCPRFLSAAAMVSSHLAMNSGGAGTLVRLGGPGGSGTPALLTPLPASGSSGATACCGPNTFTGNE
jgi:hypothetical protein